MDARNVAVVAVVAVAVGVSVATAGIAAPFVAAALAPTLGFTGSAILAGAVTTAVVVPSVAASVSTVRYTSSAGSTASQSGATSSLQVGLGIGVVIDFNAATFGSRILETYGHTRPTPFPGFPPISFASVSPSSLIAIQYAQSQQPIPPSPTSDLSPDLRTIAF